jgi:hypothetical protein
MTEEKEEILPLTLAGHYKPLHPYAAPNSVKDFPVIDLPIAYLHYKAGDKDYYFSIMPKAHGQEFLKIMNAYVAAPTQENKQKLQKAYATLGRAHFHKVFMKPDQNSLKGTTLLHGDLHVRNIFYDAATDIIYWIDNEVIGITTLKPRPILHDIRMALFMPFDDGNPLVFNQNIRDNPVPWVETFYSVFFDNYLNAFGGNKGVHLKELRDVFQEQRIKPQFRELGNKAIDKIDTSIK